MQKETRATVRTARLVIFSIYTFGSILGQAPASPPSTFEVASVKPSGPDTTGMFIRPLPGGSLQVAGTNLRNLICFAFDVRPFQVIGASQWVDAEKFDIDARTATSGGAVATTPTGDRRKILEGLKGLLADRFQLTLHSETKEQAVYVLVINKGGPKFKESTNPNSLIRKMGPGTIKGQAVGLKMLALNLSNELGRQVIDNTGLIAKYDFELNWEASQGASPAIAAAQLNGPAIPTDSQRPSIFTALQEQLGLRLESSRGPVEVLVIDHAARPSKN